MEISGSEKTEREPDAFGRGLNSLRIRFTILIGATCIAIAALVVFWLEWHAEGAPHQLGGTGLTVIALFTLMASAVTYLMTGKLTRPIENLKTSTEAIAKGDFNTAVTVDCSCEVGGLADSFRKMVARLNDNVARINTLAYEDGITGLPNRAVLSEVIKDIRKADGYVLFVDLDRFKQVNDIYGHQVGDELLRRAAQRMLVDGLEMRADQFRNCLTPNQLAASPAGCRLLFRFAGDEFVALVTGSHTDLAISNLANRLISSLSEPFVIEGRAIQIGASVGIVGFGRDVSDPSEILKFADLAMYEAKKLGRGRYAFFDEAMRKSAFERAALEKDFPGAITRSEFEVHYQPIFSAKDGRPCGLEGLVRWRHPSRGLLYPGSFLQVVGSIGALDKIGREVMTIAARDIPRLRQAGHEQRVSINVCPTQFADDAFAWKLISFVKSLGVRPQDFVLEITENTAMTDVDKAIGHISRLKEAGFEVAIDDFGTGYSNLARLTQLPFDSLKIDRSLTAEIAESHSARSILLAVVNMAHGLGRKVVVEGVEDKGQLDVVKVTGCDEVQGYFTGRPVPFDELMQRLQANAAPGHIMETGPKRLTA